MEELQQLENNEYQRIVTIRGNTIIVKKLPLKKYRDLINAIQELPKHLDRFENKSYEEVFASLPFLISTCYDDVVRVLHIAFDSMTTDQIEELAIDELMILIDEFLVINNYSKIFETLKNVQTRLTLT